MYAKASVIRANVCESFSNKGKLSLINQSRRANVCESFSKKGKSSSINQSRRAGVCESFIMLFALCR